MRWGLIARPETDRGLGIQTRAMADNLHPDLTIIIDTDDAEHSWTKDFGFRGDTVTIRTAGPNLLPMSEMRRVLRDSDIEVLVTVEAWYDDNVLPYCRDKGIRTVNQMNAEFFRRWKDQPDRFWWPTSWRPVSNMPIGVTMPVPVPWVAEAVRERSDDEPIVVTHVVGKQAIYDRNGTRLFIDALRYVDEPVTIEFYAQTGFDQWEVHLDAAMESFVKRGVEATIYGTRASTEHRAEMFVDCDLLVLPRRYGGLCLSALDAIGSGAVVGMPDCSPNTDWPIHALEWDFDGRLSLPCGEIQAVTTKPRSIGEMINTYARDRDLLREKKMETLAWARAHSWDAARPLYLDDLETLARRRR